MTIRLEEIHQNELYCLAVILLCVKYLSCAFTHNGDRLTGITSNNPAVGNHALTFDGMGNPTRHRHWNMEWTRGRLLMRKFEGMSLWYYNKKNA